MAPPSLSSEIVGGASVLLGDGDLAVPAVALYAALRRRDRPDGYVFALDLGGYRVIRFVVPFFRGDDVARLVLGVAHSQYTALAMIAFAAVLMYRQPHGDGGRSSGTRRRAPG